MATNEPLSVNRPRGHTPGSKNKSKAPSVHHGQRILEVAPDDDLFSSIVAYARDNNCCVVVHHATGYVVGTICFSDGGPIFKESFEILHLSGTIFPPNAGTNLFIDEDGTVFPAISAASAPPALTLSIVGDSAKPLVGAGQDSLPLWRHLLSIL